MERHEQLWAPWRLAYVAGEEKTPTPRPTATGDLLPGADPQCFICRGVAETADRANLIVERTLHSLFSLNRVPDNNCHMLVCPLYHKGRLVELVAAEPQYTLGLIMKYVGLIERTMNAEGFNVGLNMGRVAGAGVPGHLHWHIVPRWHGDTNFMPSIAGMRVIPQALDVLWELLREANGAGDKA